MPQNSRSSQIPIKQMNACLILRIYTGFSCSNLSLLLLRAKYNIDGTRITLDAGGRYAVPNPYGNGAIFVVNSLTDWFAIVKNADDCATRLSYPLVY